MMGQGALVRMKNIGQKGEGDPYEAEMGIKRMKIQTGEKKPLSPTMMMRV